MSASDTRLSPLVKIPLTPIDNYRVNPPLGKTLNIAHITDTHLGLRERTVYVATKPEKSEPIKRQVSSFEKFRRLLNTLQILDPDVIIHTGDITDRRLWKDQRRYEEFKLSLPGHLKKTLFLYIRGNHDRSLEREDLCKLFPGWDILSLEDSGSVPLADGQIHICGKDYQDINSARAFSTDPSQAPESSIRIGAFHQSIRRVSSSYDANIDLTDLTPENEAVGSYYDLLLLGHMHTEAVQQIGDCMLIDGGSTLGLNVPSTIGVFTFSKAGSHYQRFPLGIED